jgi:hypothetical protein
VKYQNTVLKANEEAENGLVTFLKSHQRAKAAGEGVVAAEKAVKVAVAQYKAGLIDFNRVALLEQNLVGQQNQLAQAQGEIAQGLIHTYKALGGGWKLGRGNCNPVPEITTILPEGQMKASLKDKPSVALKSKGKMPEAGTVTLAVFDEKKGEYRPILLDQVKVVKTAAAESNPFLDSPVTLIPPEVKAIATGK